MKRSLIGVCVLGASFLFRAEAQEPEAPDTVKVIENPGKVFVSRNGDTTLIEIETDNKYGKDRFSYSVTVEEPVEQDAGSPLDFEIPFGIGKKRDAGDGSGSFGRRRLRPYLFLLGNLYVGQRFNYFGKGNVRNSYEVGVRDLIGIGWSRGDYTPSFSIGLGFGVQRYGAQKGFRYAMDGSRLTVVPVEDGTSVRSSDLFVYNFQVPLLFSIPVGCDVKFTAGAVACLNFSTLARTEVAVGSDRYKTTYRGVQQRLFTTDIMCSLGVCDIIGVYASWSPMTLFQAPYGPRLKSWSIGAIVNF